MTILHRFYCIYFLLTTKQGKGFFFILFPDTFLDYFVLSIYCLLIILIVSNVNLIICDEKKNGHLEWVLLFLINNDLKRSRI